MSPTRQRVWQWPTDEAWIMIVVVIVAGAAAGGFGGAAIMFGFFASVNILGNLILPSYRHVPTSAPREETSGPHEDL